MFKAYEAKDAKIDGRTVVEHGEYNGQDFIYTKDIGTMDRNGVLNFLSRDDRGFTRFDGFEVKPYEIEKEIKKVAFVKDCIISPYDDSEKFGKMIKADIILQDDVSGTEKEIVEQILEEAFINNSNVSTRQIPTKFIFREDYPMTKMNKVDYKAIEAEPLSGSELEVRIDETNVSVNSITVIEPKQKILKKI